MSSSRMVTGSVRMPSYGAEAWVTWNGVRSEDILEIDRAQNFRGSLIEGAADSQQTFHAGKVRAALNGADLRHAQLRAGCQILQRPIAFHTKHLDSMPEPFAETVVRRAAEPERVHCVL